MFIKVVKCMTLKASRNITYKQIRSSVSDFNVFDQLNIVSCFNLITLSLRAFVQEKKHVLRFQSQISRP